MEWLGLPAAGEDTEGAADFARSLMDLTVTLPYFHGRLLGQGATEIRDLAMRVVGQNLSNESDASLKAHLRQGWSFRRRALRMTRNRPMELSAGWTLYWT